MEMSRGAAETGAEQAARRRFRAAAVFTSVYVYALILFGGTVRITGSGLGCGDDWPRCNGHLIPPMDFETLVEYTHRLLAAGFFLPLALLAFLAFRHRALPRFRGAGGIGRAVVASILLLAVQVLLGAATVKLDLPAGVTALHLVTAMLILGAIVLSAVRASDAGLTGAGLGGRRFGPMAMGAAVLGLIVVGMGALTANLGMVGASGAPSPTAFACQGFPLCNGALFPAGGGMVHTHWTHRVLAYLLALHVLAATVIVIRRGAPAAVRRAAISALALVIAQVVLAAALVLMSLPDLLRAGHLALGTALWTALVIWAAIGRRADRVITGAA